MASDGRAIARTIAIAVAIAVAVLFAVQGGEFSSLDLLRQRRDLSRLGHDVDSLQGVVDSLRRYELALRTDPATQERIAREDFGMVRGNREILYRFAEPQKPQTPTTRP